MTPALGRTFDAGEFQPGRDRVALVSHRLWVRRFGSDPAVVGKSLYMSQDQMASRSVHLVVRAAGDAANLAGAVQSQIHQLDRTPPAYQVETLEGLLRGQVSGSRALAVLTALFGVLALVLAAVGIYGVVAWTVKGRNREIGLRMALGAQRATVLALVLRRGMLVVLAGVAVGTAGAYALARALASILYGVAPTDPEIFLAIPALLAAVALAAVYIPARRATRVDPVLALRQ